MFETNNFEQQQTFSISEFPSGIYFVRFEDAHGRTRTEKIIKY